MIGGALPASVRTRDDVLAILPAEYRRELTAPVRDALVDALFALLQKADDAADYAAAQSDPLRAVGAEQDGLFEDRGQARAVGELDESFRERALAVPRTVTFAAIRDAVNLLLAPFTDDTCRISDWTLDRWFVGHTDAALSSWHSHIGRTPTYPDRLFDFPVGTGVTGNDPGGVRLFEGHGGRQFLLRIPDLTGSRDAKITPVGDTTDPAIHATGWFVGQTNFRGFVSGGQYDATIYQAIVNTVNTLVGHSVRWTLLVDPKLNT